MKITFYTSQPHAPCSNFYENAFKGMESINFYDQNFQNYDIALIMTYDHQSIKHIREKYPHLKIGIIDPRNYKVYESTKYCDFIVIDSIEMEDFWRVARKPIFRYVEYPSIPTVLKTHEDKQKIIIGYHGNQIHLKCMAQNITPALSLLGQKYDLELMVMYNGKPPEENEPWVPQNLTVRHVPWSMDNYVKQLGKCDVGIVPNNLIHDNSIKTSTSTPQDFNYSLDDYSLRFKMPSNPGRLTVFGILGIPVVADFYPSALQYLQNGCGFVAHSQAGWYHCLEKLIISSTLRQEMGNKLQSLVQNEFDFDIQNKKFISFLESMV